MPQESSGMIYLSFYRIALSLSTWDLTFKKNNGLFVRTAKEKNKIILFVSQRFILEKLWFLRL